MIFHFSLFTFHNPHSLLFSLSTLDPYYQHIAFTLCSRNGTIIPLSEALLPVTNIELLYGFGVYENIRVVRGKVLFIDEHIERLMRSAHVIGLENPFKSPDISSWVRALVEKVQAEALNLKILLLGAGIPEGALLFILPLAPLFPEKQLYKKGAMAITVELERQFPDSKSLSMLGSYLAFRKAKAAGAYDALLINRDGCITEGTRTNFFALKDRRIIGAPKGEILEGVTMRHVLEVAANHGFTIEEEHVRPDDLPTVDGAFLTSTSSKVMPLSKVDEQALTIPETLNELMGHFDLFLETVR